MKRAVSEAESSAAPEHGGPTKLKTALLWLGASATAGVVGNRADAAFLTLQELVTTWGLGESSTAPISPLPTPSESPLPTPDSPLPTPTGSTPRSAYTPRLDFDWITIPAGYFWMGSDKDTDRAAWDNELPQHQVYLPEYRIARVPVTVAQFAEFINATQYKTTADQQGSAWVYTTQRRWEETKGANWAHPRGPNSDVAQKANHPVTCVSWHDAAAFCAWAQVRLPSEAEWEKAARGTDGRIYPWGNAAPDETRCNFNRNVNDTTSVGHYGDRGASPYGLVDMAGNVWEWTSTLFKDYPYKSDDGRENTHTDGIRTLRGGSWIYYDQHVRCAYRDRNNPVTWNNIVGFRVVSPGS